ncbi:UpxY family transcription antiterminator [Aquimarina sp. RZ0]|uniref:UpxY family transcription antiterminator n=1 Tax=Aquimarina sp. RZ0 TaxID=2607730 RepID=UPI0011F140C8|nr:UpxY family transcription antiterminator [Aquimarina sp. RZ0]KAA1246240.1 UpxY family transcription antiterminator [Aquimarina sp. RZ0]
MQEIPNIHLHMDMERDISKPKLNKNWYVFYTAPRAEKIVHHELSSQGYEVFLPIKKTLRIWKNRQKKVIDQVLFPSYIFVNTEECNLHKICQISKIMTFIHCGGKASKINAKCIKGIKKMLSLDQEISVEPNFKEGEHVRIIKGPLSGYEGILVKQKSKTRLGIRLNEINQVIFIDISSSNIENQEGYFENVNQEGNKNKFFISTNLGDRH